jgi:class 3 adenylate cyclase
MPATRTDILEAVPYYMDRHDLTGATPEDLARAHVQDVAVQERHDVRYITYWFDYSGQSAFCLATGPDRKAVEDVHREAHGLLANEVIQVDEDAVRRFMGGIVEHAVGEAYVATALRAILFTDIEGSTSLTQRLGDAGAMTVLRAHDRIARGAIARFHGSEVKHTGDGLMASFPSIVDAVQSAVEIQRQIAHENAASETPLKLRIGIAAGEPVTEGNDLFGAAVQLAARLCERASPDQVLVTSAVRDLAMGKGLEFNRRGPLRLKGFDEPVRVYEVAWQGPSPSP